MRKAITILFSLFSFYAKTQVYSGTGGAVQNNGLDTYFPITISGLSQAQLDNTFGIEEICLTISHPAVPELQIHLASPVGTMVQLTEGSSCNGADYTGTCFNMNGSSSITLGAAPYTGTFKPIGSLGRFNNGQAGIGTWTLIIKDYLAFLNPGVLVNWSIKFGTAPAPALAFTSSDLPIVTINTNNQPISDVKMLATMGIIYNGVGVRNYMTDPLNNYNGNVEVRLRGNSSKRFEKKPFYIETCDALGSEVLVPLLGMPAESEWVLIAMYQDKSLIRVPMTYDLSRRMGNYAARFKMVEVVINNEYRGVYALMEKLKRDEFRVNVPKLSPLENTAPAVTGGYIIKIDRADEPGWNSLYPGDAVNNARFYYQYVYPKDSITIQQKDYIKSFLDTFETVMSYPNFYADPWAGYQKYVDMASLVDFFILNELSKNVDAYRLSTYLYKDKISTGGKLHLGPVWDYDLAWHNCNYSNSFDPTGWQYQLTDTTHPTPIWWSRFMQDTSFTNTLYCRWVELRQNILSTPNLLTYVDSSALALNESQQRNFTQWPVLGAYISPNPQNQSAASYQTEVADLKNWISTRAGWMDWAIQGHCPVIGIAEHNSENGVNIYPNPSNGKFTLHPNDENGQIDIYNTLGENVFSTSSIQHQESNLIDISSQPKGIYFYQLNTRNSAKTGKIIIQ